MVQKHKQTADTDACVYRLPGAYDDQGSGTSPPGAVEPKKGVRKEKVWKTEVLDDAQIPHDAVGRVIRVLLTNWKMMFKFGTKEVALVQNRSIRYQQTRDMAFILRAVIPMAVEMASSAKPEWTKEDSALARVVHKWVGMLTARDLALDSMVGGYCRMFDNEEEVEAFMVFGGTFSLVLSTYLVVMPHLVEAIGEMYPELAEDSLSGIVRVLLEESDERDSWLVRWWSKRRRRRLVARLVASGRIPSARWAVRFMQGIAKDYIVRLVDTAKKVNIIEDADDEPVTAATGPKTPEA